MTDEVVFRLVALKEIEGKRISPKGIFDVGEAEALELIVARQAWVVAAPSGPPLSFLATLEEKLEDVTLLGPRTDSQEISLQIEDRLFRGGIRQAHVDGSAVNWVSGKGGLRRLFGETLSGAKNSDFDLFHFLRYLAFSKIGGTHGHSHCRFDHIYTDEFARARPEGLNSMAVDVHSRGSSSEWANFGFRALCLQADFEMAVSTSLRHGRIIVGQATPAGDRYLPPQVAGGLEIGEITSDYQFARSDDLPDALASIPLDARRKRASKFIQRAYDYFYPSGRMFTVEIIKSFIQGEYDLTPNAAKEAWNQTGLKDTKFSNKAERYKVLLSEIREFADIERGK